MSENSEAKKITELASALADDPRVVLATERTLLAWVRTGLGLMGFGFLVAKFGLLMREFALNRGVEPVDSPTWSFWIGAALVLLGTVTNIVSALLHQRYLKHVNGVSLHFCGGLRLGIYSAWGLAVLGFVMTLRLLFLEAV